MLSPGHDAADVPGLIFHTIAALERELSGGAESFAAYFLAIYHCSPDDHTPGGIVERRERLREHFPSKVIPCGQYFVLSGEAAWRALTSFYFAAIACETLSEGYRSYIKERLVAITQAHLNSQSLPVPVDLTEGQLADDPQLEFLTQVALRNGQVRAA